MEVSDLQGESGAAGTGGLEGTGGLMHTDALMGTTGGAVWGLEITV